MYPLGSGPFLAMNGPFIAAAGGSIALSSAAATVSGTTVTVTATSSGDLSEAVFGVEYSILDNGGSLTGYTFSKNVVGAASSQSITVTAADGVTSDSTVTVRAYYNIDVLDDPSTRVYANDIVPYVVAGGVPTGTQTEGQTLTQVQGVIAGSSPLTVTYQWQNDGGTGTWANINGATSATYELQASDVGDDVAVVHTGTNSTGTDSARSAETGAIQPNITYNAFSNVQAWAGNAEQPLVGTWDRAFVSTPTAGNIIVCAAEITAGNSGVQSLAISDDMTDGGTWNTAVSQTQTVGAETIRAYVFWKIVGATANSNKTIILTASTVSGTPTNRICDAAIAEFSATGTISVDSTNSNSSASAAVPTAGALTLTTDRPLCVALCSRAVNVAGIDAPMTIRYSNGSWNHDRLGDLYPASGQTDFTPTWPSGVAGKFIAVAAAFKAVS